MAEAREMEGRWVVRNATAPLAATRGFMVALLAAPEASQLEAS